MTLKTRKQVKTRMSAFCGQYFPWAVSWPYFIKSEPNYLSSSLLVEHDFPWFASLNIELNHPPLVKRCFWGNCNVSIIAWRAHVRASEYKGSLHLPALLKGHLIQSKMKIKQLNYGLINTQMSENFLGRQVCNLMIVQLFFIEILQLPLFSLPLS